MIAVFAPDGDWATKQFVPDHNDDVLGWQYRGQINALQAFNVKVKSLS